MGTFSKSAILGLALAVGISTAASSQAGATDGEWRYYGGGPGGTAYSPLDQIDATNVGDLEIAWTWAARNQGPRPEQKNSSTPLMVDGVLYVTAGSRRNVTALDAGTGEMLWMWRMDEGVRAESSPRANSGRGVAYWTDGQGDDRIYVITPAYHLVALDAHTGREIESFGANGVVDLRLGLDQPVNLLEDVIGSSSPPVIARDVIVVGAALAVGTAPPSRENVAGHVRGFDVRTGERKWIFHTIPQEGEFGYDTWLDGSAEYTGNAAVWPPFTADEELGIVYLPVEDATGDYFGGHRPGDNLFSASLVALNVETGELIWHFQLVHHDIWDYDAPTAPILTDITVDGREIQAVAQITKQSFVYVFDRVTGEPVWPIEERPVPAGDVPGEWYSPTQPFPTRPAPFDRQGLTIDDLIDFTPELRAEAEEVVAGMTIGPLYTPQTVLDSEGKRGTLMTPGSTGGANWEGGAFDPETGVLYVASKSDPAGLTMREGAERSDMDYIAGFAGARVRGLPVIKPPWGRITAIDLNTGDHLWMQANGDATDRVKNNPALEGVEIGRWGKATRAGILVTKALVLAGEGYGGDPHFYGYDKATGEIIADLEIPASQTSLPMTYMHDGEQYVVFTVGGGGYTAELIALKLP